MVDLTQAELGSIEKCLDELKIPSGAYRDGYRDCLKALFSISKSQELAIMMAKELSRILHQEGVVLIPVDVDGLLRRFTGESREDNK